LLREWKWIWEYSFLNFLILFSYGVVILLTNTFDLGHDEYGLAKLSAFIFTVVSHIALGFLFAIGYRMKNKKKTTTNNA
jgi:hypothetical protein